MALNKRYYQNVNKDDKDNIGKVYELLYIDDTDPRMVMYHMTNGGICNETFIQSINGTQINKNTVYVEVPSPRNIWRVECVQLKAKHQTRRGADGQEYEIPDLSMCDINGKEIQEGEKINFYPPVASTLELPSLDMWRVSVIVNKLNKGEAVEDEDILKNIPSFYLKMFVKGYGSSQPSITPVTPKPEPESVVEIAYDQEIEAPEYTIKSSESNGAYYTISQDPDSIIVKSEIPDMQHTGYIEPSVFKASSIMPPEVLSFSDDSAFKVKVGDNKIPTIIIDDVEYTIDEIREIIKEHNEKAENIKGEIHPDSEFVENLVNKAVKHSGTTTLDVEMQLPAVSTYKLIHESYGTEIANMFIRHLAIKVPVNQLVDSLTAGLHDYYTTMSGAVDEASGNQE